MKYTVNLGFSILFVMLSACVSINGNNTSIKQGIMGRVRWLAGNNMPSPDRPQQNNGAAVVRQVYIYKLTKFTEAEGEMPLFSSIKSKLVAKVKTNKEGYFQCKLMPGKYSVFTLEENGKFFANLSDGDGNISPVEVVDDKVTTYNISINFKASY